MKKVGSCNFRSRVGFACGIRMQQRLCNGDERWSYDLTDGKPQVTMIPVWSAIPMHREARCKSTVTKCLKSSNVKRWPVDRGQRSPASLQAASRNGAWRPRPWHAITPRNAILLSFAFPLPFYCPLSGISDFIIKRETAMHYAVYPTARSK